VGVTEPAPEGVAIPAYEHDCDDCIFVGGESPRHGEPQCNVVDMYVHVRRNSLCLIRRYSSHGWDYGAFDTLGMGPTFSIPIIPERYRAVLEAYRQHTQRRH
jgi:hypothetical protein